MNTPQILPYATPASWDDDLARRCFPTRFRKIGSPFAYLNEIGLTPILEFIYKGNLLIDVAEAVDLPVTTLSLWVQHEGHTQAIEEAETQSAEGYLADGMRRLKSAPSEFELRRAKEMIRHAQYMASKKNKPVYGDHVDKTPQSPVTYVFNVGDASAAPLARSVIEHTTNAAERSAPTLDTSRDPLPSLTLNLGEAFGIQGYTLDDIDAPLPPPEDTYIPQFRLVAARPAFPTPTNPDAGPFFELVDAPDQFTYHDGTLADRDTLP